MALFRRAQEIPPEMNTPQMPPPDPAPYAGTPNNWMQQNAEIVDFALSNERIIESLKNQLRGIAVIEKLDKSTMTIVMEKKQVAACIMNETGIFFVAGFVENQIYRNTMLANLTERDVAIHNIENSCSLSRHLIVHRLDYEYDLSYHDATMDMIENVLKYAATRGINRGEALSAYGSRRINEVKTSDEVARAALDKQGKGLWG